VRASWSRLVAAPVIWRHARNPEEFITDGTTLNGNLRGSNVDTVGD
jgi:hypothetical protein